MLSCTPGYLVSTVHGEFSVEEYNIDRTSRQMGMDHCVTHRVFLAWRMLKDAPFACDEASSKDS